MIKSTFRDWNLDKVGEAFGLTEVETLPILEELLTFSHNCSELEVSFLTILQKNYRLYGGDDWNEFELENKMISPMIVLSEMDSKQFAYFLERELRLVIGEYDLSGKVDGMIATGFRSPKMPYFCLNEYKKGTDPDGDPRGQVLIAMLVAQQLNNNQKPIFGCYVIGRIWYFVVLVGNEYAISRDFSCAGESIFDIFRILKGLRFHIERLIKK